MKAVMNTIDDSTRENSVGRSNITFFILLIVIVVLAAMLWAWAIWETYYRIPVLRAAIRDFNVQPHPLPGATLDYPAVALPTIALAGVLLAWRKRSRWIGSFVVLWLPLAFGSGLCILRLVYENSWLASLRG
jgi:hypothetical protein